jgi:hypothetical protein
LWPKIASDEVFASVGFGEIPWLWKKNFQFSDLAVAISSYLAKADSHHGRADGGISDILPG